MANIRCRRCGGQNAINGQNSIIHCEYCGEMISVPYFQNDREQVMFERANSCLKRCAFDEALENFQNIKDNYPDEPEAYWGILLCRYGIEYVDDPYEKGKKVPTCHRTQYESILNDPDYQNVLKYADDKQYIVYEKEAALIAEVQREALNEVQRLKNEKPYDIFISYKKTDENNQNTYDSEIAYELYKKFASADLKVFFSEITLKDKSGEKYEPIIYSALYSAKIMIVVSTNTDYLESPWVKNEWGRYVDFLYESASDNNKKIYVCYENISIQDIPDKLSNYSSQFNYKDEKQKEELFKRVELKFNISGVLTAKNEKDSEATLEFSRRQREENLKAAKEKNDASGIRYYLKQLAGIDISKEGKSSEERRRNFIERNAPDKLAPIIILLIMSLFAVYLCLKYDIIHGRSFDDLMLPTMYYGICLDFAFFITIYKKIDDGGIFKKLVFALAIPFILLCIPALLLDSWNTIIAFVFFGVIDLLLFMTIGIKIYCYKNK